MPDSPLPLPDHVRAFLAQLHPASVATVDADGAPRQTVAWYALEADGRILLNSRMDRRWPANILRDRRVALAVVDGADQYRWLGITGVVDEVVDDVEVAREDIVRLAHRYHPEGPRAGMIADFRTQPRITFRVRITGLHDHLED
jgi:PPOX class probable F420-dependent enzyme